MIHFILIRHGETAWTKAKRYQGQANTNLTKLGKKQVKRLVKPVSDYQPEIVFSSSLDRCKESASIICQNIDVPIKIDRRLNELNFGEWEGKTADELIESKNVKYLQWIKGNMVTPKGGESIPAFKKRIRSFINDCRKKYDDRKIVIVTHGGAIRMFLLECMRLSYDDIFKFRIDPGTMTVIGMYRYSTQLVALNCATPNKGIVPDGCI